MWALPVISVSPVHRPKVTRSPTPTYMFSDEREFMKEKIRTALRIAASKKHLDICLGAFGCEPRFGNPALEVATLWKEVLYKETEFNGRFTNVVFAIDDYNTSSGSKGNGKAGKSDLEIFKEVFDPEKLLSAKYRPSDDCRYCPDLAGGCEGRESFDVD